MGLLAAEEEGINSFAVSEVRRSAPQGNNFEHEEILMLPTADKDELKLVDHSITVGSYDAESP